jgi:hypothetical protein
MYVKAPESYTLTLSPKLANSLKLAADQDSLDQAEVLQRAILLYTFCRNVERNGNAIGIIVDNQISGKIEVGPKVVR